MGKNYYIGAITSGVSYLLRALFTADNQGYADEQVLDTEAEGVQDGQLTVIENDGTLAIVSNKCAFTAQSTPVWGDLGFYSESITKSLGKTLLSTVNKDATNKITTSGIFTNAQSLASADWEYAYYFNVTAGIHARTLNAETSPIVADYSASTDYQFAIVLGGFNGGLPFYSGQTKTDYKDGAWYLIKGGSFSTWTLLWIIASSNTSTLYGAFSNYSDGGTIDAIKIPDADLSAVQEQITNFSSFTASNGTSLDAITPEVGGSWTEQTGNQDIQSNQANSDGTTVATCSAGISDFLIKVQVTTAAASSRLGVIGRFTDTNNYWLVRVKDTDDEIQIFEVNGGVSTKRATTSVTIDASTSYDLVVVFDGQDITGFVDGGGKVSYGSASHNQTETLVGIHGGAASERWDNFMVFPRTDSDYDTTLDAY